MLPSGYPEGMYNISPLGYPLIWADFGSAVGEVAIASRTRVMSRGTIFVTICLARMQYGEVSTVTVQKRGVAVLTLYIAVTTAENMDKSGGF